MQGARCRAIAILWPSRATPQMRPCGRNPKGDGPLRPSGRVTRRSLAISQPRSSCLARERAKTPSRPQDLIRDSLRMRQSGFTLLELLVALSIFAVISVAAYSGLQSVLTTERKVVASSERLGRVQMAFIMLERDIQQVVVRGIRDEYGLEQPALAGGGAAADLVVLTRAGWDNPLHQERATLERLAYRIDGSRLIRLHWDTLDRGGISEPREVELLDDIAQMSIGFLAENDSWQSEWPPSAEGDEAVAPMPRAVRVTAVLNDWGEITRIFPLIDGPAPPALKVTPDDENAEGQEPSPDSSSPDLEAGDSESSTPRLIR